MYLVQNLKKFYFLLVETTPQPGKRVDQTETPTLPIFQRTFARNLNQSDSDSDYNPADTEESQPFVRNSKKAVSTKPTTKRPSVAKPWQKKKTGSISDDFETMVDNFLDDSGNGSSTSKF